MYVSVDFGGTNTRVVGSENIDEPIFIDEPLRHHNTQKYEDDLNTMIDSISKVAAGKTIEAIGLATPGVPNVEKTQIESATNIPQWNNKPLVLPLSEKFGCTVYYENDAVAAGLGEAYYGGQINDDFHYIVWGTGIGGASVEHVNNQLKATKLIWKTHFRDWEKDCSGASLTRFYKTLPEIFDDAQWLEINSKFHEHLQEYVYLFKPGAIILGGGLSVKNAAYIQNANEINGTKIFLSKFGNDDGLMGGFGIIKHSFLLLK